jgi:hypothetical protein
MFFLKKATTEEARKKKLRHQNHRKLQNAFFVQKYPGKLIEISWIFLLRGRSDANRQAPMSDRV